MNIYGYVYNLELLKKKCSHERYNQLNVIGCADDSPLYLSVDNPLHDAEIIKSDISSIDEWSNKWLINCNALKTYSIIAIFTA